MKRTPRPAALVFIGAIAALLVASGATGNSKAVGPENKTPPSVSPYLVKVGSKLTGDKGLWQSTKDITYSYTWLRCNVDGENCSKISGATETTYKVAQADVAHTIRFQVKAKNGRRHQHCEIEPDRADSRQGRSAAGDLAAGDHRHADRRPAAERDQRQLERDEADHLRDHVGAV